MGWKDTTYGLIHEQVEAICPSTRLWHYCIESLYINMHMRLLRESKVKGNKSRVAGPSVRGMGKI